MRSMLVAAIVAATPLAHAAFGATQISPASRCAVAWNRDAGAPLLARVARTHARAARVDAHVTVTQDEWTQAGVISETSGPGCGIDFALANGRAIVAFGGWVGRDAMVWRSHATVQMLVRSLNADVHADGTVGFHG